MSFWLFLRRLAATAGALRAALGWPPHPGVIVKLPSIRNRTECRAWSRQGGRPGGLFVLAANTWMVKYGPIILGTMKGRDHFVRIGAAQR